MQQHTTGLSPRPIAKVIWPRPSLAGCIMATFVRDTRGCQLTSTQRMNHFAAAPFCGVSWFIEGGAHLVDWPAEAHNPAAQPPLPRMVFHGPHRAPTTGWNPGPVYAVLTMFHSDAIAALTGMDVGTMIDRVVPAEEVLSGELLSACEAMWHADDSEERYRHFEDRLDPLWQKARPPGHVANRLLQDWTRSLAVRAVTSGAGRSLRQAERRVRSWTGRSLRGLQAHVLTEKVHETVTRYRGKKLALAQLAAEAGFADQAHMTRHMKRETGFTPDQLRELIETDEGFWCYRLMGERF